jgi:uncharacterized protein (TIGR03067 family)
MRAAELVLSGLVAALAVAVGESPAAPVPKHLMKPGSDKDKLQGKWKLESLRMGGVDYGESREVVVRFTGGSMTTWVNDLGQKRTTAATVMHHPDQVRRFTMRDATMTSEQNGRSVAKKLRDEVHCYDFDGNKLLLTSDTKGQPVDPLKPGKYDVVLVFVRVKP